MNKDKLRSTQVFTPEWVTNEMLDLLNQEEFTKEETFYLEPSCGEGDMLIVILERIFKLYIKKGHEIEDSLARTLAKFYAIDLDFEVVTKCRISIFEWASSKINRDLTLFESYLLANNIITRVETRNFFEFMNYEKKTDRKAKIKKE